MDYIKVVPLKGSGEVRFLNARHTNAMAMVLIIATRAIHSMHHHSNEVVFIHHVASGSLYLPGRFLGGACLSVLCSILTDFLRTKQPLYPLCSILVLRRVNQRPPGVIPPSFLSSSVRPSTFLGCTWAWVWSWGEMALQTCLASWLDTPTTSWRSFTRRQADLTSCRRQSGCILLLPTCCIAVLTVPLHVLCRVHVHVHLCASVSLLTSLSCLFECVMHMMSEVWEVGISDVFP